MMWVYNYCPTLKADYFAPYATSILLFLFSSKMMRSVGLLCLVGVTLLGSASSSPLSETHAIQKRQTVSKFHPHLTLAPDSSHSHRATVSSPSHPSTNSYPSYPGTDSSPSHPGTNFIPISPRHQIHPHLTLAPDSSPSHPSTRFTPSHSSTRFIPISSWHQIHSHPTLALDSSPSQPSTRFIPIPA